MIVIVNTAQFKLMRRNSFRQMRPFFWGSLTAFAISTVLIGGTTAQRSGMQAGWYSIQPLMPPFILALVLVVATRKQVKARPIRLDVVRPDLIDL